MIQLQEKIDVRALTVPVSSLRLLSNSRVEIDGKLLSMSGTAFKDLIKLSGLTQKAIDHLNSTISNNAGFKLIKEVMKAVAKNSGNRISLLISPELEIQRIRPDGGGQSGVSPEQLENIVDYALSSNDAIKLVDVFTTDGGTKATVNFKYDNPLNLGIRNEDIAYGKQIQWDMLGSTQVSDFVERLVCTNGMTAIRPAATAVYLTSQSTSEDWYKHLIKDIINPNREVITHYADRIKEAQNTNLSVAEYNVMMSHLLGYWKGDEGRILRYFGDDRNWKTLYDKRGINLEELTVQQLKNCPTPVNAWDAVNCLTDLASHKYNATVSSNVKKQTQQMAGRYLNRDWDAHQQISNVPTFEVASLS